MMTADTMKSARLVRITLVGTAIRGKYTLEIRLVLAKMLPPLSDTPVEKNCHGNVPQSTRMG